MCVAIRCAAVFGRAGRLLICVAVAALVPSTVVNAQASGTSCEAHLARAKELLANTPDSALVHALEAEKRLGELGTEGDA